VKIGLKTTELAIEQRVAKQKLQMQTIEATSKSNVEHFTRKFSMQAQHYEEQQQKQHRRISHNLIPHNAIPTMVHISSLRKKKTSDTSSSEDDDDDDDDDDQIVIRQFKHQHTLESSSSDESDESEFSEHESDDDEESELDRIRRSSPQFYNKNKKMNKKNKKKKKLATNGGWRADDFTNGGRKKTTILKWKEVKRNIAHYKYIKGDAVIPEELFVAVNKLGGYYLVKKNRQWQRIVEILGLKHSSSIGHSLNKCYQYYFPMLFR